MGNLASAKAITFLDIETTHLDPKKSAILSISIITDWDNGQQDVWTTKIRPADIEIEYASPEALRVCKYDFDEWMEAPPLKDVAEKIISKLKYGPLVAHNIQFDISHLKAVFNRYGYKDVRFGYPLIDTCALAYLFLPSEKQNMSALREHFNISKEGEHTAEKDVADCREIFYKIIGDLSD